MLSLLCRIICISLISLSLARNVRLTYENEGMIKDPSHPTDEKKMMKIKHTPSDPKISTYDDVMTLLKEAQKKAQKDNDEAAAKDPKKKKTIKYIMAQIMDLQDLHQAKSVMTTVMHSHDQKTKRSFGMFIEKDKFKDEWRLLFQSIDGYDVKPDEKNNPGRLVNKPEYNKSSDKKVALWINIDDSTAKDLGFQPGWCWLWVNQNQNVNDIFRKKGKKEGKDTYISGEAPFIFIFRETAIGPYKPKEDKKKEDTTDKKKEGTTDKKEEAPAKSSHQAPQNNEESTKWSFKKAIKGAGDTLKRGGNKIKESKLNPSNWRWRKRSKTGESTQARIDYYDELEDDEYYGQNEDDLYYEYQQLLHEERALDRLLRAYGDE